MSIALGNTCQILEATVHEICKTSNRFESTFIHGKSGIGLFLGAKAARLDEVVTRLEKLLKNFRTIIK